MKAIQTFSYNLKLAKVFGVCSAVFIECVNNEYEFQSRNNLLNANSTVALSRAEIYECTGLDDAKQEEVEVALMECNVLNVKPLKNVPNKNYYIINGKVLCDILNAVDVGSVLTLNQMQFTQSPRVEPMSKRQTTIMKMKKEIKVADPVINQYFVDWVDSVYSNPKGFLSKTSVAIAQQELAEYAGGNQDVQIAVLKIAIKGGLRDMTWAIENYEKQNGVTSRNFATYKDIKAEPASTTEEVF